MARDQRILTVDVHEIERSLVSIKEDAPIEELYRFGTIMVSSAQQRAIRLDSKLTGILGWASAVLAFILIDAGIARPHPTHISVSIVAMVLVGCSVAFAYGGIKSRHWPATSEQDWFRDGILEEAATLKRYHIISMLNVHQSQSEGNEKRAFRLRMAEIFLAFGALFVFGMLFYRLLVFS